MRKKKKRTKKPKSFWSENGVGIALVVLTIMIGLGMPASVYIRQAQLDKEYMRLVTRGEKIEGIIIKDEYLAGTWHEMDRKTRFHEEVEIEYKDENDEAKILTEKWPAGRKQETSDKTGSKIALYALPENRFAKIASTEYPRVKKVLKLLESKSTEEALSHRANSI